jgi:hypothetical protein
MSTRAHPTLISSNDLEREATGDYMLDGIRAGEDALHI